MLQYKIPSKIIQQKWHMDECNCLSK